MNGTTHLHRQINPSFIQNGRPSSQAFRPSAKDEGLLSVYDGDMIEAPAAMAHFITILKFQSAGVMALTVEECLAESLPARPDPEPFPEHAVIDFTALTGNQQHSKSKKLRAKADVRGWLCQPSAIC